MSKKNKLNKTSSDFTSELIIKSSNAKKIKAVYEAIEPETKVVITQRGKTSIFLVNKNTIIMNFYAADFVSLRAMLGSYLRWLETIFISLSQFENDPIK